MEERLPRVRRPTQAIHLTHRSGPCLLPCGAPAWSRGRRREGPPCECGRRRIARIVSQGFHRLFGGECSGSSGYIVVAAGREDSRGLGSPMTEFLPRRPRVLGSPRLVALAKEGVPPEWEPGCGAPRRQRSAGPGRKIPAPRIASHRGIRAVIILCRGSPRWNARGSWDGLRRERVQICHKGAPARDRRRTEVRNINDSASSVPARLGFYGRFG